jgi:hypothetical protein
MSVSREQEGYLLSPDQYCHINLPKNPLVLDRIMQYLTSPSEIKGYQSFRIIDAIPWIITLLLNLEEAYLKDGIDGVRILLTVIRDKSHAVGEARRRGEYHQIKEEYMNSFTTGDQT